jgi:endonuclease G
MRSVDDERLKRYLDGIVPAPSLEALLDEQPEAEAATPGREALRARRAIEKLATGRTLSDSDRFTIEAIVIPDQRPAVDIVDGDFTITHPSWLHFSSNEVIRGVLRRVVGSVGRIELPGHPRLPYGGTGFVVGPGLLMTNRHVAELFAAGLGAAGLSFRPGLSAGVDFRRERDRPDSLLLGVRQVVMIHPYWDMALLRVDGLTAAQAPLPLSLRSPDEMVGSDVAVIGYPAFDPRNDAAVQHTVFGGVYNVKRLQPGKLGGTGRTVSFGKTVEAAVHDSSTLGGNSGSAVVDVATGEVVGVHFAGHYLLANYAVPASELARDGRVVDAGVAFAAATEPEPGIWDQWWQTADPAESAAAGPATAQATTGEATTTLTVPLAITVRIGTPAAPAPAPTLAPEGFGLERMVEPIRDMDYTSRTGYEPDFLGVAVPLPEPGDPQTLATLDNGDHVIPYHHFSVVMHKHRRLALFTACNLDASPDRRKPEPGRDYSRDALSGLGDKDIELWFTDPRIPELHQLPDRFFTRDRGAFDRGHLVRREDVAWGHTYQQVRFANGDSFHTTNCSPQVAGFNRPDGATNWGALETLIQRQAGTSRLCIFAGPVLSEDDRIFTGVDDNGSVRVQIPSRYWKIVIAAREGKLRSFAFLLTQDLANVPLEFQVDAAWRPHMTTISSLEKLLLKSLRFPEPVHAADQAATSHGQAVRQSIGLELVQ